MARLGDVCKLVSGNSLPEMIVAEKGELPYVKVAELNLPENIPNITTSRQFVSVTNIGAKQIIPVGTVIFPKRGGAIGTNKKRLVSTPICMDLNLMGAIPSSKLYPQYLYYFFENIDMGALSNGSSVPQINNSDIAPLEIRIPDITTQKDIATRLDKVTELIALRKEQLAKLDQLVKSRFIELFGNRGENPYNFPTTTMGNIYKFQYGKGNNIPEDKGEYPCYGSNGVVGHHTEYNSEDSPIIGHIGAYAGIVNWGKGKHYVTYNGVICKLMNDQVNPVYGYYLLQLQDYNTVAKSGAAQPFVSYKDLDAPVVNVPPMDLQKHFAAFVEQTDKSKLAIQASLDKLELLKKSLMQEYFG